MCFKYSDHPERYYSNICDIVSWSPEISLTLNVSAIDVQEIHVLYCINLPPERNPL